MSTILKALKKLEQEKEALRPSTPTPVFSSPETTAGEDRRWLRSPWVQRGALGLIILALGLSAFYYYRISRRDEPHPSVSTGESRGAGSKALANRIRPDIRPDPRTAGKEVSKQTVEKAQVVRQPRAHGNTGDLTKNSKPSEIAPNIGSSISPRASREAKPLTPPQPVPVAVPDQGTPGTPGPRPVHDPPVSSRGTGASGNQPPADQKALPAPAPAPTPGNEPARPPTSTPSNAYENTPRLTDGRLKVHAIAWSAEAEERMAVVNSRVVHEGDSVDGFLIVAIRPEDVVVQEKEKGLFRVVFGRP